MLSPSQANVQPLRSGNYFVGWGQSPFISEYREDGTIVFDAKLHGANSSYRAYRMPWLGKPRGPVAIDVRRARGNTSAWVSWNGDNSVKRWRILGGPNRRHLEPLAIRPRDGFETVLRLRKRFRLIQVQGIGANGKTIGRTRIVPAR